MHASKNDNHSIVLISTRPRDGPKLRARATNRALAIVGSSRKVARVGITSSFLKLQSSEKKNYKNKAND